MALVRMDLGITQQQLADTIGISRSLVAMAERGNRRLPARGLDYLKKLQEIGLRMPPPQAPVRRRRPVTERKRPPYNRVHFSAHRNKAGTIHSVTIKHMEPILYPAEVWAAGERLRERLQKEGNKHPTSADACRELLSSLEHKGATIQCRLEHLELDLIASRTRGLELAGNLKMVKGQLKIFRQAAKDHPSLRKKFRRKVAVLYLKKLYLQDQLEKFNRPALVRRKQVIAGLQWQLGEQQAMSAGIKERMLKMEQGEEYAG